jgi:gliding motility-associated-like protein
MLTIKFWCCLFLGFVFRHSRFNFKNLTFLIIIIFSVNYNVYAQTSCSLGDPVFVENFGSGSARLGPSLNQDPINNVYPNFRPAKLYKYEGFDHIGQEEYGLIKNGHDIGPSPSDSAFNDNFPDHTPDDVDGGSGYFYYGDAGDELNMFFAQKISGLCDDIQYELSAWFSNTNRADFGSIEPNIKLIVGFTDSNDNPIGSVFENNTGTITSTEPRWKRGSLVFTVPSGTANIYFMLQNNISGRIGNDLGIDDIEVRPCGPEIDITDQLTNNLINGESVCITDTNDRTISLSANIPNNFVMQWEESTTPGIWTDIVNETSNTLNYTIPENVTSPHSIRLKFAHNPTNLLNTKCHFFTEEITYNQTYAYIVSDLEECDNLDDGDNFNGIVQTFDLESQTATILGTQSTSNYTVTYHLSSAYAIAGIASLTSPHANTASPDSQTIYVRVENKTSGCINTALNFNLIVNPLPIANTVSNLEICDDATDGDNRNGIVQTFDLEAQTPKILGTQSASDYTLTYHLTVADAISGSAALTNPHANTQNANSQPIYARITNTITGCVNPYLTFDLIVNALPFANPISNIEACDNLDDGNDSNGIIQTWDLERQTASILGTQSATNYTVTYHLSLNDAELGNNALLSPHTNTANPYSQTIYVRVENNTTNCVNPFTTFNLIVNPLPVINSSVVLIQCDDDNPTTLGFSPFNLTEANIEISDNAIDETFTYFLTQAAAISGDITSPDFINNPTVFENRTVSNDAVWARIENSFGCARFSEILLNVSTTVIPSSFLASFNQCDDFLDVNGLDNANNNDRDGIATFDFSSVHTTVLGFIPPGQNPLPPRYFRNEADALAEINEIIDISNYRNIGYPDSQFIYVRIDSDIANDCLGLGAHILLNVEPLPIANTVSINRQCDDDSDGEFPFDTSHIEDTVLGTQSIADVTIEYFDEIGNPLPSPLPNPFLTASQTITVRVTNNTTLAPDGPCYDETSLEFIVDVSPIANPVVPFIVCDGDSGDVDDDGLYPFNTSNIERTVLGSQTDMDVFYTYQDENGTLINNATSLPNPLNSSSQTITVNVANSLNSQCVTSTNIDFIVNPLPEFSIETPQIVCSSDPTFTIDLDPLEDNTSETFLYEWVDEVGTFISNNPTLTVSTSGTYFITLTKADGTGCSRTKEIFVNASELATITRNDITIVEISDNNTITINETALGLGDYEYTLDDEFSSYQSNPFFDHVKGGIHTLFVRDKNGCGTTSIDISLIDYPNFFTPNNDGYNDSWQIFGINSQFQPQSDIYIFDRFGKLLKQLNPLGGSWNGMFNGMLLPTDDYWFRVMLQDGRELKGHFTLKR